MNKAGISAGGDPGSSGSRGRLVLASRSPQRRAILEQLGIPFEIRVPDVAELKELPPAAEAAGGSAAAWVVYENARRKAHAVAQGASVAVLGVDTEVLIDEDLLGKASGPEEARAFLERLSGRTHTVLSGLCLLEGETERGGVADTHVTFRTLSPELVSWYLDTGEWRDRAGAYAIQGHGAALIERIDGDYWNVVGLPVPLLLGIAPDLLQKGE